MTAVQEYLDGFADLKRVRESCGICEYVVAADLPGNLARAILQGLPPNRELWFYDESFPSPSDAGAHVSVRRAENGAGYLGSLGNHGWSQPLVVESFDSLAARLQRCLPVHCPARSRERLRLVPIAVPPQTAVSAA